MTICLVAKCWSDNCIVSVSDRRLSYGDLVEATDDATLKAFMLYPGWGVMFSASDISSVNGLIEDARARLRNPDWPQRRSLTIKEVKDAVCGAYHAAAHERIISSHLARFGFNSVTEFLHSGLEKFGSDQFGRIVEKIEKFDLGVDLLVYGFDDNPGAEGHIFEIQNPGVPVDHDMEGFGVIGSGSWQALAVLSVRGASGLATVNEAVYRLCESKFCAESASGVGRATTVMVFGANGRMRQLPSGEIDNLRGVWNEQRKKFIPDDVATILGNRFQKLINSDEDP